ncbi:unnamed protein product, partial [marine sediment metagenome]
IKYNQKVNIWYQYFSSYNIARNENDKANTKSRCEMLHFLKYANRSYLIDVSKYCDINDTIQDDKEFDYCADWYKKQFKNFVSKGCIQNQTTANGYLHNLKKIVLDNDHDSLYWECYQSKNKLTFNCPITGEKEIKNSRQFVETLNLTQNTSVYMSYKSKIIKIAEFRVIEKSSNEKKYDWKSQRLRFQTEKNRLSKYNLLHKELDYQKILSIKEFFNNKNLGLSKSIGFSSYDDLNKKIFDKKVRFEVREIENKPKTKYQIQAEEEQNQTIKDLKIMLKEDLSKPSNKNL